MLQNAYFLANIGADTAENEQHFAEILPIGRRRPPGLLRRRGHPPEGARRLDGLVSYGRAGRTADDE